MIREGERLPAADELAEAIFAAEDELLSIGCGGRRLPFGRLLVDRDHPAIYDVNCLRDVRGTPSLAELDAAFDEALEAGCRHRRAAARDPRTVRWLDQLLLPRTYTRQVCLAMAHLGPTPAKPVPRGTELVLVDPDDEMLVRAVEYAQDRVRREEAWYSADVSRQMDELALRQVREGGANLVAAVSKDGEVYGSLLLLRTGDVGFIADVGTAPGHRRRGIASALVAAAVALSRGWGSDVVGLTARRDDRPRRLYERLGFVAVGESVDWLRGA